MLSIISLLTKIKKNDVYFDNVDEKWHVENRNRFFLTKAEAEAEAESIFKLIMFTKIAEELGLNYGYDGKKIEIYLGVDKNG